MPDTASIVDLKQLRYETANRQFQLQVDSFHLGSGESLAITGKSGSGKTTLLSLIAGLESPTSGSIRIQDEELSQLSTEQRNRFRLQRLGIIFQDFRLIEYLTLQDNISVTLRLGEVADKAANCDRVQKLAEQFEIGHLLKRYPHQVSHGERQRAAIARALFHDPALILADEPTGNLDPATAAIVLDLLLRVAKEGDHALLLVTHDHSCLDRFDRTIDMSSLNSAATAHA
ncbi:ABC transporter ATP-binding protein [Rubinisphaera margarita]|uniref:ABC transporter ATP-binding protein n=1 Tax=Rubinisphaera margarita TaxID=2909586 RepID=UPI001EE88DA8|nr:ABC transporter ATP-binding protein [Rubinisphaera margarita]MCG6154771.1 ABC transporter ATP-binding protein [Rubinisphaera margarita]